MLGACLGLALMLAAVRVVSAPARSVAMEPVDQQRQHQLVRLVRQDCGSCHGLTLRGGLGKSLQPEDLQPLSVEQVAAVILEGMPGTPMPPWKGELRREEAFWIAARLKEGFPP